MITEKETTICDKIKELFQIDIYSLFNGLNVDFRTLNETSDLVTNHKYFVFGINNMDLKFTNRSGFLDVLLQFIEITIEEIPNEFLALEAEKSKARYWDDVQHFYETEALSEKESKLNKAKIKLLKELKKTQKNNPKNTT